MLTECSHSLKVDSKLKTSGDISNTTTLWTGSTAMHQNVHHVDGESFGIHHFEQWQQWFKFVLPEENTVYWSPTSLLCSQYIRSSRVAN